MLQIALVSHEHDYDIRVGVVAKFLKPAGDVDVCRMFGNVVDEERAHGTAVVAVAQYSTMQ